MPTLRLRNLPFLARLGLTGFIAAFALGLWASAMHLVHHYEKRDGAPGLTLDDITAAYRGIDAPAPLSGALARGHPDNLSDDERDALIQWLASDRITETYDALELGDAAPAEIIARECLSCHSRTASPAPDQIKAVDLPLDYWDDVQKLVFARNIPPTPREIVIASMHAHALTMAALGVVIGALALASAFPRVLVGLLIAIAGLGLAADLASWLVAPHWEPAIRVIVGAGFAYNASLAALLALVFLELWRPRTARDREGARA